MFPAEPEPTVGDRVGDYARGREIEDDRLRLFEPDQVAHLSRLFFDFSGKVCRTDT